MVKYWQEAKSWPQNGNAAPSPLGQAEAEQALDGDRIHLTLASLRVM